MSDDRRLVAYGGFIPPAWKPLGTVTYRVRPWWRRWWFRRQGWSTEWTVEWDTRDFELIRSLPRLEMRLDAKGKIGTVYRI